jgi:pseudaminic acid biosynthesis-associated methylase
MYLQALITKCLEDKVVNQLKVWEGEFGQSYTDRNEIDWRKRLPAFQQMLVELPIARVLEVGCNRGHNLIALAEFLGNGSDLIGVEPNQYALEIARASSVRVDFLPGNAFDLPFKNEYFDLVFTAGVLIHIPLTDLSTALAEIYRVSKRYILAIEYFAEKETVIDYRGHNDLLWKRDFRKHYQAQFPSLILTRSGYWGPDEGFDRANWWLFEKTAYLEAK